MASTNKRRRVAIERVETKVRLNRMHVVIDAWRVAYKMRHKETYQHANVMMSAQERLETVMIRNSKPNLTDVIYQHTKTYE